MSRLLIVVLITCFCGIPVFADETAESNVYIVQNVFTPESLICLANEITGGVYFFSKPCGETLSTVPSSTINLIGADGTVYKTLHGIRSKKSLVDAGSFYVFDGREKKYQPDIEKILKPGGNASTVWYPDLSRKEMVSSEIKLTNTGSGKLNVRQPLALNASGVIAYKGGSPLCMVDDKKEECLALKDRFLWWGNRYSCYRGNKASANLSFYCNSETFYCNRYCENKRECQLTYSSHASPDRIQCTSGFDCLLDRKANVFFCSKEPGSDTVLKAFIGGGIGAAAISIFTFAVALTCHCVRQSKSKAFHNKYAHY